VRLPFDNTFEVTQVFGVGKGYSKSCRVDGTHNGVDYGTPIGTPILASEAGTVIRAYMDNTGYGIHVRIKNNSGGGCLYAHLKKVTVMSGQKVKEGDQIGVSGNSGNSTGPHLHWEYRTSISVCATCVDPLGMVNTVESPAPAGESEGHKVAWETLRVRLAPSLSGKEIGMMAAGDEIVFGCGETVEADGYTWQPILVWCAKEGLK
jgi:murein DD-endopeptidase MepM/ murein hydrolase activator NlpD